MTTQKNVIKEFFKNTIVKSIILTVLPLTYGIAFPYAIELDATNPSKGTLIFGSIVMLILHIVVLIAYGCVENRQKQENSNYSKTLIEIKEAKKLIKMTDEIVYDVATSIHGLILEHKEHSEINDWKYMEAKGDIICREAFHILNKIAEKGEEFSVSIMFRQTKDGKKGYTMLSRVANDTSHKPKTYRNFVGEDDAAGYCYKKIFDEAPSRPMILPDKKAIGRMFKDADAVPYTQYIGLPIICKENRVVGVLQIVAYNDSIIAKQKKALNKLCDDYFCVFATLMLLIDKYENVQQCIRGYYELYYTTKRDEC